jgi:hypothetical protein
MAMAEFEKSKFRFSETFNNADGKTSGSGFVGVIMGLVAVLGFAAGLIGFFFKLDNMIDVLESSLQLGLLSAALMGVRKASGIFSNKKLEVENKE